MSIFGEIKDPRRMFKGNYKHPLIDIVFLVISVVISGCNDWETIEVLVKVNLIGCANIIRTKMEYPPMIQ